MALSLHPLDNLLIAMARSHDDSTIKIILVIIIQSISMTLGTQRQKIEMFVGRS